MKNLVFKVVVLLVIFCNIGYATSPDALRFQTEIKADVSSWATNMMGPVTTLFWLLVTLDFSWTAIQLALKAGGLEDFASTIIKKLFFYGFAVLLLTRGTEFADIVVDSFIQLAGIAAGVPSANPVSEIWDFAFDAIGDLYNSMQEYNWLQQAGLILLNGIIIICMCGLCAYISVILILAFCETYIVISLSLILLAFNGSNYTSEYGRKFLHFAMLSGLKLFATIIMAYLGIAILQEWAWTFRSSSVQNIGAGTACFAIYAILVQKIPGVFVNVVSGGGLSGTGESIGSQAVKMAAVGTMAAATGGASAVGAATSLAKAEGASGFMGVAGGAAKNLGKAFGEDMKGSFSATNRAVENSRAGGGNIGDRMAANMDKQTRGLKDSGGGKEGGNSISAGEGKQASTGTVGTKEEGGGSSNSASSGSSPGGDDGNSSSPVDSRTAALEADGAAAGGAFSRSNPENPGTLETNSGAPSSPEVKNSGSGSGSAGSGASAGIASDFAPPSGSTVKADSGNSVTNTAFDPTGDNMGTSQGDSAGQIANASGSAAPAAPPIRNSGAGTGAPSAPSSSFTPPVGTTVSSKSNERMEKLRKDFEGFQRKPF